jgi:predicted component of type VI protein secretion system
MADPDTLFWPSLYARLAPSRYGGGEEAAPRPDAPAPEAGDAAAERFGEHAFFTDFDRLRRHVETELVCLLNASCLESALLAAELDGQAFVDTPRESRRRQLPFHEWPEIRTSIVNYGLPAIIGASAYALTAAEVEQRMREAILAYEPRIRGDTLRVEILSQKNGRLDTEVPLQFVVEGEIRGAEDSVGIVINTIWDPERLRSEAKVTR